jgi:hypothetical protein
VSRPPHVALDADKPVEIPLESERQVADERL